MKTHHSAEMVFDPSDPDIDHALLEHREWTTMKWEQLGMTKILPANMQEPRGFDCSAICAFVDHATDSSAMTCKSRSGFLIYLNNMPTYWLSEKQTSVEPSLFGSAFYALKQCTEYYMVGIPYGEPTYYVSGDTQSVLDHTAIPELTLKKKLQSIAYHFVPEGCVQDEWRGPPM
jgi:hypothetical protein